VPCSKKQFVSAEAYFSVLLHEASHSTGHPTRLNRPLNNAFSSIPYSFEELISELSSAFIMACLGYENRITDNVAYIESWLQVMKDDKKFVISAASHAQAAANYILQVANVKEIAA
jgi:antirestriction protein ArdC